MFFWIDIKTGLPGIALNTEGNTGEKPYHT